MQAATHSTTTSAAVTTTAAMTTATPGSICTPITSGTSTTAVSAGALLPATTRGQYNSSRNACSYINALVNPRYFLTRSSSNGKMSLCQHQIYPCLYSMHSSGVARPGPTRACALPSTSQALPSPAQQVT